MPFRDSSWISPRFAALKGTSGLRFSCHSALWSPATGRENAGVPRNETTTATAGRTPIRVLIVEGDPDLRSVLGWVLRNDDRLSVIGEVGSVEEGLASEAHFEVALVGLAVSGLGGPHTIAGFRQRRPAPAVVVFSPAASDPVYLRDAAIAEGAARFVTISEDVSPLTELIVEVALAAPLPTMI
jgi:CheY-like chemotaxis protein